MSAATDGGGVPRDVTVTSLMGRRCVVLLPKGWTSIVVHKLSGSGATEVGEVSVDHINRAEFVGKIELDRLFAFDTDADASYCLINESL